MKINKTFLSVPPYLSTTWDRIATLRLSKTDLLVTLLNGDTVTIPNLPPDALEAIFNLHVAFLEEKDAQHKATAKSTPKPIAPAQQPTEFKIGFGPGEGINAASQHNPELANAPDIPGEVLAKIGAISKIIAPEDIVIPQAVPNCNCPYCQIARALLQDTVEVPVAESAVEPEEEVKAEELRFEEWEITQSGDKLFTVTNKLDSHERYSVYLGHPVGCTCGKDGCEHILAVLKS